ncbi:MAG: GTP 3',8-cyclase MoaA [Alphaproteobacteria bacterium]|nr:GTP 3',8-cyclase MoaA [Alphaproteobacteria bacterium]
MPQPTFNEKPHVDGGKPLIDRFGRQVTYVRISVTDRCDFRCSYCMSENMVFLPKREVLSLEEFDAIASAFVARGVTRIRLTGGEPLVRRDFMTLIKTLSRHLDHGLEELTLTTNGSQLPRFATALADNGIKRINVSLDTLDAQKFTILTRRGRLDQVLEGIEAALGAGLKVKINTVALKGINDDELADLIRWAHGRGMDHTLIETMPMGDTGFDRLDHYLPLSQVQSELSREFDLVPDPHKTGGPARYMRVAQTGGRLGFITPLTHNFCEGCNRVRLTCTGELYLCLGQEDRINLRDVLRSGGPKALDAAFDEAMRIKPRGHDFKIERLGSAGVSRHMSVTGG